MSSVKSTPPISENKDFYYTVNSDTAHPRILVGTGQELVQYRQDTSIRIWYNDLPVDYETHWHTAMEVIMPMENWYEAIVRDESFHIVPGDIFMIPPGEMHSLKAPETGNRFVFLFDLAPFTRLHGFAGIQPLLTRPIHLTRASYPNIYDDVYQMMV